MAVFTKFRTFALVLPSSNYSKQCHRWMSTANRPIAALDTKVEEGINKGDVETRRHAGVYNRGIVRLPDELKEAVDRIIADRSSGQLKEGAYKLNNHIAFKKPPMTAEELEQLKVDCQKKVAEENPIPDVKYLSAEDVKRLTDSLTSKAQNLYRQKAYHWKAVEYNESTAITYMAARLAPDFASFKYIFNEISQRDQQFKPTTMFDFGSGVGSALWAAKSSWNPKLIKEAFCVDSSIHMNSLALALLQGGVWPKDMKDEHDESSYSSQKGLFFRQFLPVSAAIKYNLVVCGHSLLELPSAEDRLKTVLTLWRKTRDYLVLVEHGSRAAYEVLMEARSFLLSLSREKEANLKGHVFAPCPNDVRLCPRLSDATPCNFQVAYEPLLQKQTTGTWAKERFTYIVMKKGPRLENDPQWPRVVRPVITRSRHTICRLCSSQGKLEEVVITRGKHNLITNRCARNTEWGDLFPVSLSSRSANDPADDEDELESLQSENEEDVKSLNK